MFPYVTIICVLEVFLAHRVCVVGVLCHAALSCIYSHFCAQYSQVKSLNSEVCHGGSIYTTEIGKCHKSGLGLLFH